MIKVIKSMTGYGQAVDTYHDRQVSVEIKTVNHRFLDFSFKLPRELTALEDQMKTQCRSWFNRGRIDIWIQMNGEPLSEPTINVNWPLLNQYLAKVHEIKDETGIPGDITINHLLQLEGLLEKDESNQVDEALEQVIRSTLEKALANAYQMRIDEGETLRQDVLQYNEEIKKLANELNDNRETLKQHYYDRVLVRLQDTLKEVDIDHQRLVQEVAMLADKGDITEEVTRLLSHTEQIDELLSSNQAVGRQLDFLSQELHREANTIGSKANDIALSKQAIALKSVIEKIKEQVQNIE
ncbi:uncharacterized protein (TIGR00255 family) [Alkalibacillus salilacus]|uniref:Uncharacterized protein (TIGR00255 family) n=2 Tax=Alkalibacillus salilacus TaxID=284582 RepID=A0ABT9VEA8_9BACI|nr:uncharacterized protein (TIGR00255 family) [Alkalibacillus salilacus]